MIEAYTATSASENARPLSRPRDDDKKIYTHAGDVSLVIAAFVEGSLWSSSLCVKTVPALQFYSEAVSLSLSACHKKFHLQDLGLYHTIGVS